jgi:hypothetical protein
MTRFVKQPKIISSHSFTPDMVKTYALQKPPSSIPPVTRPASLQSDFNSAETLQNTCPSPSNGDIYIIQVDFTKYFYFQTCTKSNHTYATYAQSAKGSPRPKAYRSIHPEHGSLHKATTVYSCLSCLTTSVKGWYIISPES